MNEQNIPSLPAGAQPQTGQASISCPVQLVKDGIDTIHLSLSCEIPGDLLLQLKEKKEQVQSSNGDEDFIKFGSTGLFDWNLSRQGKKFFPFVLRCGDVSFALSGRRPDSSIPSAMLQVGSISCHNDLPGLLDSFRKWCKFYDIKIYSEKVSRVDLCADLVTDLRLHDLTDQDRFVSRAEKFAAYYSNRLLTGVQIGTGGIVLRMYDKIQEMVDKQAAHKMEFFTGLWGTTGPITRVEFQIRREKIKEFLPESSTFADLCKQIPAIWRYLTDDWFRHCEGKVDRLNRNQGRVENSQFWQIVCTAHQAEFASPATRTKRKRTINIKGLIDQAAGIMLTVAAGLGVEPDDTFGIFATINDALRDKLLPLMEDAFSFEHDFDRRRVGAAVTF